MKESVSGSGAGEMADGGDYLSNPQNAVPPVEGVAGGGTGYGWTDGGFQALATFVGDIDPVRVPSAELLNAWFMPSTTNIGRQEQPQVSDNINLLVARNERESTQIALRPKVSWGCRGVAGTVKIQCTDLCSTSGDRLAVGKSLTMRQVMPILGVPDALAPLDLPAAQINLSPGETSAVWISIDVPADQQTGLYEGQISVTAIAPDDLSSPLRNEKYQIYQDLQNCLEIAETVEGQTPEDVVERVKSVTSTLRKVLTSSTFSELTTVPGDMMDEDVASNISIQLKLSVTIWDFTLPLTPSLPAVFGISETVIEDRFGVKHGSNEWHDSLDRHFNWLLKYRISPFFCRWGDGMRVLAYTCPWPADNPKSDEYYSNPRLAAYAVPYFPILSSNDAAKDSLRREVEILRTKSHWKKAYFYLWDEPLNLDQYSSIRNMSSEIRVYAPDARVLTTYYCGPSDASGANNTFEAFVKVPSFLRPHTQIYCTSEWVLGNREDLAKDIIGELQPENGEEWWTYVCMGPSDPHPNWHLGMRGTQHRAVMWRVWKEGGTGFLYWGANCYEKAVVPSAEIRFRRGLPPGDGVLFYPGEVFSSSHEPVASTRLERTLSGLQDFEYLNLYASRYGREAALNLLERTGIYLGPERYTYDHYPIDSMRAEIYHSCKP